MKSNFDRIKWANFKNNFKSEFGQNPSVLGVLFLIGLNESPNVTEYTKEQKQEVIHVGLCTLLMQEGIYKFSHFDEEGWPHFSCTNKATTLCIEDQETYIKNQILKFYDRF